MSNDYNNSLRTTSNIFNKYVNDKNQEIKQCIKNYTDLATESDGSGFLNMFMEPMYTQLKNKLCDPQNASIYMKQIIDHPDTIYQIKQKLDTIETKLDSIDKTIAASENKQETSNLDAIGLDVKTIVLIVLILVCFLILSLCIFMKS